MEPFEAAKLAVQAISDKQGSDIRLLKTTELTVLADYFLICTANSTPHVRTLYDEVDKRLSEAGMPPVRREGYRNSNWLLLDFGCLIVQRAHMGRGVGRADKEVIRQYRQLRSLQKADIGALLVRNGLYRQLCSFKRFHVYISYTSGSHGTGATRFSFSMFKNHAWACTVFSWGSCPLPRTSSRLMRSPSSMAASRSS